MYSNPSGFQLYSEYYLYSQKAWEMAPSGVTFLDLAHALQQNAPIVVTASGLETTNPTTPFAQVDGSGKYEKVGYGYFHALDNGQYDPDAREFSTHPDSSGKIVFNGPLRENVFVEYESGPSGYYILDTVDYNPVRNEAQGGFVFFTQTGEPATIYLSSAEDSIRADGYRGTTLTAILYDNAFNRMPSRNVIFEIQNMVGGNWSELGHIHPTTGSVTTIDASGSPIIISETTNRRGEAYATYHTFNAKSGIAQVKAYFSAASGVSDIVQFAQFYFSEEVFILDLSLLDSRDYLI